jgi:hypothetical protein
VGDWTQKPRVLYMAGRRKATQAFCLACAGWHDTRRSVGGAKGCEALREAVAGAEPVAPAVRRLPPGAQKLSMARFPGGTEGRMRR